MRLTIVVVIKEVAIARRKVLAAKMVSAKGNSLSEYDAIVIGSGPNGFASAICLAREGFSVALFESKDTVGGGMRSAELTLPGFKHDICSAIHPLGVSSPFFTSLPLDLFGLKWIQPPTPLAHPFDNGSAALLEKSIEATSLYLGEDAEAYKKLMTPLVNDWEKLSVDILGPLHFPKHPLLMARFGLLAIQSSNGLCQRFFKENATKGLFAGIAAHAILPLDQPLTAAFGLILGILGHAIGWPLAEGGSQSIANALAAYFRSLSGKIFTGVNVDSIDVLPSCKAILCDISPKELLKIAGHRLPEHYKRELQKYRYGPGVFKIDWALNHPIPWTAKECLKAGTVHVGGTAEEITLSEKEVAEGKIPEKPYIILAQQSLFDKTRAPEGKHTAWGYCHVPNGSNEDMIEKMENQIERFAPGFRDCILARSTKTASEFESYNANYVGGDINGGVQDFRQLFMRPAVRLNPYTTPLKNLFICSSSTPPGGGVHGMCGYHAASACIKYLTGASR